jgi:hypothetical protein
MVTKVMRSAAVAASMLSRPPSTWSTRLDGRLRSLTRSLGKSELRPREQIMLGALRLSLQAAQTARTPRLPALARRTTVRARQTLECRVERNGATVTAGVTVDIGTGGLCALVHRSVPVGGRFAVTLRAPDDGHKLLLPVEVVWVARHGEFCRVGFRFVEMPERTRHLVLRLVLDAASRELLEE